MQDTAAFLFSVTGKKCTRDLCDSLPDFLLRDVFFLLFKAFNQLCHVATLTVLHYDIDLCLLLVNYAIVIADNIWVMKLTEDVNLADKLLFLFFVHPAVIEFLPYEDTAIGFPAYFRDNTERAFADIGNLLVIVHDLNFKL